MEHPEKKNEVPSDEPKKEPSKTVLQRLDELEILVRQNMQWNQLIYQESQRTRKRLGWMAFGSWVKLFLILLPIILGIIFIPPFIREAKDWYEQNIVAPQQKAQTQYNNVLDFFRQ